MEAMNEAIEKIKELLNRIILAQGITGDIAEKLNMGVLSFPDGIESIGPGSKVKIEWQDGMLDNGFIFTLPTPSCTNVLISGIIMCPDPSDSTEPVWLPIQSLSNNPLVKSIEILKK